MATLEAIKLVISDFYNGKNLKLALADNKVSRQVFYETIASIPQLADLYSRARKSQANAFSEEIIEIADSDLDPQRARNRIDARKWYASKVEPTVYGDRLDINVSTVDLNAAITEARARVLPSRYPTNVVDAEIVETKQLSDDSATGSKPANAKEYIQEAKKKASADIFD